MRTPGVLISFAAAALILSGCSGSPEPAAPSPEPDREYITSGAIIEADGVTELCWTVLESYPPQCGGGVALEDFDWSMAPDVVEEGGVRFVESPVIVQGTVTAGEAAGDYTLTVTDYPSEVPPWSEVPSTSDREVTQAEFDEIAPRLDEILGTWSGGLVQGVIRVSVPFDEDGTLQRTVDEEFGEGVVLLDQLLRPAPGS